MKRAWLPAAAIALAALGLPAAAQASSQAQASSAPRPLHIDRSAHLPSTVLPHLPRASNVTSTNWGGYAAVANSGIKLRYVQAEFNVPSIDCARSLPGTSGYSYVAHWVGLDGYNGSTVEQTGVEAYCHGTSSAPVYFAWYEMYPQLPVVFSGIYPGDAIDASVYWNGSSYALHLLDQTANAQFNVNQSCPAGSTCRDNSAEVITEDPGGAVPSYNLPAFGSENYDGATVTSRSGTGGTLAAKSGYWSSNKITMVDPSSGVMAAPSALYGGQAFSVLFISPN